MSKPLDPEQTRKPRSLKGPTVPSKKFLSVLFDVLPMVSGPDYYESLYRSEIQHSNVF